MYTSQNRNLIFNRHQEVLYEYFDPIKVQNRFVKTFKTYFDQKKTCEIDNMNTYWIIFSQKVPVVV
jgi:hypothetical protein